MRETFGFVFTMVLNDRPDGLHSFISHIRRDRRALGLNALKIHLSEWNNTPSQQDLLNDTCYKSCYLIKNILENYDRLDSFSYWSVSDLMSEAPLPGDLLFGGLGLFTANGLPKASYYALCLLSELGDHLIGSGEGWFATRSGEDIILLAYHYIHLSRLYASGERFIMTSEDRCTMFRSAAPMDLHVNLHTVRSVSDGSGQKKPSQASPGNFTVREYLVGREGGSLYDAWVRMGCPDPDRLQDRQLLSAASMPAMRQYKVQPSEDQLLQLHVHLQPLDVRLVIISP